MLHPTLTQHLAAERQQHLRHEASRRRLARIAVTARRRAAAARTDSLPS